MTSHCTGVFGTFQSQNNHDFIIDTSSQCNLHYELAVYCRYGTFQSRMHNWYPHHFRLQTINWQVRFELVDVAFTRPREREREYASRTHMCIKNNFTLYCSLQLSTSSCVHVDIMPFLVRYIYYLILITLKSRNTKYEIGSNEGAGGGGAGEEEQEEQQLGAIWSKMRSRMWSRRKMRSSISWKRSMRSN